MRPVFRISSLPVGKIYFVQLFSEQTPAILLLNSLVPREFLGLLYVLRDLHSQSRFDDLFRPLLNKLSTKKLKRTMSCCMAGNAANVQEGAPSARPPFHVLSTLTMGKKTKLGKTRLGEAFT